jgi:two-component system, NtrC family, sensor kinase
MPESPQVILIADDREENRYISSRILRSAGYSVIEAASGREVLEKAANNPALIILDVHLPDILGYEVCRHIKTDPKTGNIPVLQVSASFVSSESRVRALDSGADAYLILPIEPTVLIATVRALLRLREAESMARLAAAQWQSTFDALNEGIALVDSDGHILRCNRGMSQLSGKTCSEIEGESVRSFLHREFHFEWKEAEGYPHHSGEVQNGNRRLSIRTDPIQEGGSNRGAVVIVTDVTERKLAEEALRATDRLAAMGRLANSIAHEINNPLEALTNLLYLLKTGSHDAETAEYVAMATDELERIARITKQTLAFNRNTDHPIEISLPELLDGVVTLYSPEFNRKNLRVIRRYESPPPISAFPGELRQVFANILRNALEALPIGGQLIIHAIPSADWKELSRRGVRICILDSGTGMSPETRKNIFEPFFTTKELKGSGLGLWLTMGIIAKHHGSITVRSSTAAKRHGTCFSIFLPAKSAPQTATSKIMQNAVA